MPEILLTPLAAFGIYLMLCTALSFTARHFAKSSPASPLKSSVYSGGEIAPDYQGSPGYHSFFSTALFFVILHLGVLVIGSSNLLPVAGVYLIGLLVILIVLSG